MQVAPGARLPQTVLRCDLVDADALAPRAIEILIRKPEGAAARDKAPAQRVHVRGDIADVDGRTRARAGCFSALLEGMKVRQTVGKTPAGTTKCAPIIEVLRQAAVVDHGVDGSGTAEHLAARPE